MRKLIVYLLLALFITTPLANVLAQGTNYRYTGQEMDPSSNLYYYGQRYYQPEVSRFTQPDPVSKYLTNPQKLKQATGQDLQKFLENPQALNEYSYVQNNPIRYTDPTGEWWKEFFTGKQSVSSLYGEIGEAAMYVNPVMSKAIDHPYITGAIAGIGGGLLAEGILAGVGFLNTLGAISSATKIIQNKEQIIKVGTSFGKLGTVIGNASGKITGFARMANGKVSYHGLDQVISRGVTPELLRDTVLNPSVRLQQAGDNILYLTKQAVVVLNNSGQVVTAYTSKYFEPHVMEIIKLIK